MYLINVRVESVIWALNPQVILFMTKYTVYTVHHFQKSNLKTIGPSDGIFFSSYIQYMWKLTNGLTVSDNCCLRDDFVLPCCLYWNILREQLLTRMQPHKPKKKIKHSKRNQEKSKKSKGKSMNTLRDVLPKNPKKKEAKTNYHKNNNYE